MKLPTPARFALMLGETAWQRAAFDEHTALVDGVVQLAWDESHETGSSPLPVADTAGAGLAFDTTCRLLHSVPGEGRVQRWLWQVMDPGRPQHDPPPADLLHRPSGGAAGDGRVARVAHRLRTRAARRDDIHATRAGLRRRRPPLRARQRGAPGLDHRPRAAPRAACRERARRRARHRLVRRLAVGAVRQRRIAATGRAACAADRAGGGAGAGLAAGLCRRRPPVRAAARACARRRRGLARPARALAGHAAGAGSTPATTPSPGPRAWRSRAARASSIWWWRGGAKNSSRA